MDTLLKRISEGITVKQYLIQKSLIFLISMFVITILLFHMNKIERYNTLNEIPDFEMNIVRMNGQNHMNYKEVIKKYAKQYRKMLPRINRNQILNTLEKQYNIKNQYVANVLVDEIVRRLSKYNKYHYRWYYIPISFLLSFVFCNIPYFILNLKKHLLQATMEEEVIQFQSIILVLMYVKRMNVETILRWLENFSCVFHPAIIRCIDDYSYNEKEAFAKLKEEEPFLPFVRLVENFESCDKIGIEKAFEGIASERKISLEKRKQENDFRIMNHAAIGKIFAYLPLILVLVLYLIIPFVLESLEQLMNNMNQLQGI